MATDRLGNTISAGDHALLAGSVRRIDANNVAVVTGLNGEHRIRCLASDLVRGASLDAALAAKADAAHMRSPHVYPIWCGNTTTWAVPAAATIFLASAPFTVRAADMSRATQMRLTCVTTGAAYSGSLLYARYAAAGLSAGTYNTVGTWIQAGASAEVQIALGTSAGANYHDSRWINLASGAQIDGMICVLGSGGNGSAAPVFYSINVEVR